MGFTWYLFLYQAMRYGQNSFSQEVSSMLDARRYSREQAPPAPPTEHMFWWGGDTVTEVTNHSRWVEAQGERNV